jgi:hypothetical protein
MQHIHASSHNPPLKREVEAARQVVEEWGYLTMVLDEDMNGYTHRIRIIDEDNTKSEYVLTQNQIMKFAQFGMIYLNNYKKTIYV